MTQMSGSSTLVQQSRALYVLSHLLLYFTALLWVAPLLSSWSKRLRLRTCNVLTCHSSGETGEEGERRGRRERDGGRTGSQTWGPPGPGSSDVRPPGPGGVLSGVCKQTSSEVMGHTVSAAPSCSSLLKPYCPYCTPNTSKLTPIILTLTHLL